jgi:hypothetical protein
MMVSNLSKMLVSAAFGAFAVRFWDWYIAPALWNERIRQLASTAGEPCVLDVSPTTAPLFKRGGMALIMKDLKESGLSEQIQEYLRCLLIARGADQAFRTKVELVNYKKVAKQSSHMLIIRTACPFPPSGARDHSLTTGHRQLPDSAPSNPRSGAARTPRR